MASQWSSSSCNQSTGHDHPRPEWSEYNRLLTSPNSLPVARVTFTLLPQLAVQSTSDSSAVSLCSPNSVEFSSFLPLSSAYRADCGSPHLYSSISLHTSFTEIQKGSSAFLDSLRTKREPHNSYPFMHGLAQVASWANSLLAVCSQQLVAMKDGDQSKNIRIHWSEGFPFSKERRHPAGEKLYCSIGSSAREITGVGKMSLHQAEATLILDNHSLPGNSADVQSLSTGEASEKFAELNIDPEKVQKVAVENSAYKTAKHLLAGAIAAMVSRTIVAPLERLKLEYMVRGAQHNVLQIMQVIVAHEGVGGFWRGNIVNLLRTAPFKSVNFFCYDIYRKKLLEITGKEEVSNFERLLAGAAAGISATLLCFPMDTIRTRMVAPGGEALGGVIGCFQHMLHTEGFLSLYKGLLPAVISMAPSGAVFYGVYDILKTSYLQSPEGKEDLRRRVEMERVRRKSVGEMQHDLKEEAENLGQLELGPMRTLLYGAIAGICAESVTYPFEVVRRQLQMQDAVTKMGALATCRDLVQRGGLGALYAGLLPSSLQVLPSAALSYFVYESMKIFLKVS